MKNKNNRDIIDDLFEHCASANELTGLYQKVSLDPEEVARFHRQYVGEEK